MKKFWIQITVLILGTFAAIYFGFNPAIKNLPLTSLQSNELSTGISTKKLKINENVLEVEIANTPSLRARGLGGRESLGQDAGMLFIFEKGGKYSFWMKGMKFGLDFIFIESGKVVDILTNIPSPAEGEKDENLPIYQPRKPVNMVLEVNAGYVSAHNIGVGDGIFLID